MPPAQNFTLIDVRAAALACVLFSLFTFAPGYALGWCTNVLSFRRRVLSTRLLIAVAISVSVCPLLAYLLGILSNRAIWAATAASAVTVFVLLIRDLRAEVPRPSRIHVQFVLILGAWALIAIGSLVDLHLQDRLYFSSTVHDHAIRAPITAAISRSGVRPPNPLYFPGAPTALRYHYLWYILGSLVDQLGGKLVEPRQALIAGCVWCGIALIALIPLYLRFFDDKGSESIHRRSLIGVGLLAVTGLDLIPIVVMTNFGEGFQADMDSWNEVVASWMSSLLWAPHHVVALIACLTGFLLFWCAGRDSNKPAHIVLAGCAFASAAGCSIYVTLVFAVFLAVWTAIMLVRRHYRDCVILLSTGLLAGTLALPYLLSLISHGTGKTGNAGETLLTFSVRRFTIAATILGNTIPDGGWLVQLVFAALLPLNYFLELGFFFAIGWLTFKKYRKSGNLTSQQLALSAMLITCVAVCTFVRSSVIANNDLGWRGFLFAQFVLVLWSVDFWPEWPRLGFDLRIALRTLLMLGIFGAAYQVVMLRMYPVFLDYWTIPEQAKHDMPSVDGQFGRRSLAMRRGYAQLDSMLPESATIQFNPSGGTNGYYGGLYANRQVVAFDESCGATFGGAPDACPGLISRILPVFTAAASRQPLDLEPVDILVFQDTDPAWADRNSWIWRVPPLVANRYFLAVPARATSQRVSD